MGQVVHLAQQARTEVLRSLFWALLTGSLFPLSSSTTLTGRKRLKHTSKCCCKTFQYLLPVSLCTRLYTQWATLQRGPRAISALLRQKPSSMLPVTSWPCWTLTIEQRYCLYTKPKQRGNRLTSRNLVTTRGSILLESSMVYRCGQAFQLATCHVRDCASGT